MNLQLDFEQAKARHILFKTKLRAILFGDQIDETPVLSYRECAVGKWIYSHALSDYGHLPEMVELEKVHTQIHTCAQDLIAQYKKGQVEEAREGLSSMEIIADNLVALLSVVEMKIQKESVTNLNSDVSDQLSVNFLELHELQSTIQKLDERIKEQTLASVQARQQAAVSESRFRNTLRQAPVGMVILRGDDFVVEMVNETYLQIVDREEKNFVGKPLFATMPEVKSVVQPLLLSVLSTGTPHYGKEVEVMLNRFGVKEKTYFSFVYQPFRESDGSVNGIIVVATEVTHEVRARYILQESEHQFRNLVTQSPVAMAIIKGPDLIIELANESLLNSIWRKRSSDVHGKKLTDVFPELKDQKYPDLLKQVYHTGSPYKEIEAPSYFVGLDGGKTFYLDFEYAPLFGADKVVTGIMITVIDVTEKVESRNKVNNAEQSLRLAIEAADMGTFDWNLEAGEFFSSPRLIEIFGYTDQRDITITHQDLIQTFHPDDRAIRDQAVRDSYSKGGLAYEVRIIWPDNTIHWINVYGKILHDSDKKPIRMYGTVIDITDQKTALEELKESETRFRLLADSMPQHVWTGDAEGNLNYFNKSVYDYSGLSPQQIVTEGWIQIVHPEDREENIKQWINAVTTGEDFLFEHRFRRYDGEYRWQLSRAIPQRDGHGKIQIWVGTSTDIHDRKLFINELESKVTQRTKELVQSNEALLKSNSELAQFAYVASHDLQEPLRKIQTFTSRILEIDDANLSDKGKDYFQRIQASSSRMQQLIIDLLSFSRASAAEKHFKPVDLNYLLQNVKEQLAERIEQTKTVIRSSALPVVNVIVFQFEQLFTNLITNAIKFSKPGVPPEIIIDAGIISGKDIRHADIDVLKTYHYIAVHDNGIGFDAQFSERIFQVFQRLHRKDAYEGTGIGLAICKKIAENHKGFITAQSTPGVGTVFTVFLPIA